MKRVVIVIAWLACSRPVPERPAPPATVRDAATRPDHACSGYSDAEAARCTATADCHYGDPVWTRGTAPTDEELAQFERGPCVCSCESELRQYDRVK